VRAHARRAALGSRTLGTAARALPRLGRGRADSASSGWRCGAPDGGGRSRGGLDLVADPLLDSSARPIQTPVDLRCSGKREVLVPLIMQQSPHVHLRAVAEHVPHDAVRDQLVGHGSHQFAPVRRCENHDRRGVAPCICVERTNSGEVLSTPPGFLRSAGDRRDELAGPVRGDLAAFLVGYTGGAGESACALRQRVAADALAPFVQ